MLSGLIQGLNESGLVHKVKIVINNLSEFTNAFWKQLHNPPRNLSAILTAILNQPGSPETSALPIISPAEFFEHAALTRICVCIYSPYFNDTINHLNEIRK